MKKRNLSLAMATIMMIIGSIGINMSVSGSVYAHKKLKCVERSINARPAGGFWRPAPCERYGYVSHIHRKCSSAEQNGDVITGAGQRQRCYNTQHQ